jgi:ParB family chromosome partitioning protein
LRTINGDQNFKYEVIAGNRRFQACLAGNMPMKALICNVSDYEASIIQFKENEKIALSDYSRGMSFAKLKEDKKLTNEQLADMTGYTRSKVQNFLYFAKIDKAIWNAVANMSKVSQDQQRLYMLCLNVELHIKKH